MIGDEDVEGWAIFGDMGRGWAGVLVFLAILFLLVYCAHKDGEECARRACPEGSWPKVVAHECSCVTPAK